MAVLQGHSLASTVSKAGLGRQSVKVLPLYGMEGSILEQKRLRQSHYWSNKLTHGPYGIDLEMTCITPPRLSKKIHKDLVLVARWSHQLEF